MVATSDYTQNVRFSNEFSLAFGPYGLHEVPKDMVKNILPAVRLQKQSDLKYVVGVQQLLADIRQMQALFSLHTKGGNDRL